MIQHLLCPLCARKTSLHPEDVANGWLQHKVWLQAKKPDKLQIGVYPEGKPPTVIDVPEMVCDGCNRLIPDGSLAVAVTNWRSSENYEQWETGYGTVVDDPIGNG